MREGTDLDHFASSVRLNRFAEKLDLDQENFEENMEVNDFIKSVDDICSLSKRLQVPVKGLPHKLQEMLNEANLLAEEVRRKDKSWPKMDAIIRRMERNKQKRQQGFYQKPSIESDRMA